MRLLLLSLVLAVPAAAEPRFATGARVLPEGGFGVVFQPEFEPWSASLHENLALSYGAGSRWMAGISLRHETIGVHSERAYRCVPATPCGELNASADLLATARVALWNDRPVALGLDLAGGARRRAFDQGTTLGPLGDAMLVGSGYTENGHFWLRAGAGWDGGFGPRAEAGVEYGFPMGPGWTCAVGGVVTLLGPGDVPLPGFGLTVGVVRG